MTLLFIPDPCGGRVVFRLGVVSEQAGPVAPTPQFKNWPILGPTVLAMQMSSSQFVSVSAAFTDSRGNPAPVEEGSATWRVDNPNVLALEPAADGLSCKVSAVGPLGTAKVSLTADADLGAGVATIVGVLDVEVTAGRATVVSLSPGVPQEQE